MPETSVTAACNHAYQLCQDVRQFIEKALAPAIDELDRKDPSAVRRKRDRAIECVFARIVNWLQSFEKLNQTLDMQAVGTGARCVFEHYLDLRWFEKFPDEFYLDRFWAFPEVDRYRAAKRLVDYKVEHPDSKIDDSVYRRFLARMDSAKEPLVSKVQSLWGDDQAQKPRWPRDHWSGEGNLRQRAKKLGRDCEDTYIQMYPTLCALVHPGATPMVGDFEWREKQIGYGYFYTFHHSWLASQLVINLLKIDRLIPQLEPFRVSLCQWLEESYATYPPV
jgi:hypothetical protein